MILSWLGGSRNSLKKGRNEDSLLYRLIIHKITVWALYTKLVKEVAYPEHSYLVVTQEISETSQAHDELECLTAVIELGGAV